MQNTVSVTNIHSIKSLYTSAKHFDDLLKYNGASYSERLDFAVKLYEMNGVPIPEICIKGEEVAKVVTSFLEEGLDYPITCKSAYLKYLDWCKDWGYTAINKQRFISIVRELTTVKLSTSINGVLTRNVIMCRPSDIITVEE